MLMEKTLVSAAFSIVCVGLWLSAALPAKAQFGRLYIKADAGGNHTLDTDLKEFLGIGTAGRTVKFDPGSRFGLAVGYELTDWFAFEGEFGVMENSIESIIGAIRADAWLS